jgi:Protein of unknown function (DUF1565)
MSWCVRGFFALLAVASIAGLLNTAACTRRGKSSDLPPTAPPLTTLNVNPKTGDDTTGNGSTDKPFKTLTKALAVVKSSITTGLTVQLQPGAYTRASGEIFPIVIPTGVTIDGSGYGTGPLQPTAAFVSGFGEDLTFEQIIGQPSSHKAYATLEVAPDVTGVQVNRLYIGAPALSISPSASYASVDGLGAFTAAHVTFAAATKSTLPHAGGVMLPGGSITCTGCALLGTGFALLAFSANGFHPTATLNGQPSESIVGANVGIYTDGTANVTSSFQTFQSKQYSYRDSFTAPVTSPVPSPLLPSIDFGGGSTQSPGGNIFIAAHGITSEISIVTRNAQVFALANTWNPLTQGSNAHGQYPHMKVFGQGARGRNVTIAGYATASRLEVGPPAPPSPTPNPSFSPGSPSPFPSPTPT